MPTISFSLQDLSELSGKKLTADELRMLLEYGKAEIENISGDEVCVKFDDTNLPYLWSAEGIAMLIRGILGKQKGIPTLKTTKTNNKIIVDKSTTSVRPYIAAFTAKGVKINEYLLKQMIQLQEKLCDSYGRRRQKIAVGLYPAQKINFPVTYAAVAPNSAKFVPLGDTKEMTLSQILENHPKGKEYKWILEKENKYPLLIDAKKEILSFPPIINSQTLGKLETGESSIFFEATGTDYDAVNLAATIFAYALSIRGFAISAININYANKKVETPSTETKKIKISKSQILNILGLELSDAGTKKLLEKMHYNFSNYTVEIPPFRQDIMHERDILEDLAIAYGYNNMAPLAITTFTLGQISKQTEFISLLRELLIGQGFQEVFSAILTNKITMQQKMKSKEELIEIDNYTSQTYSAVRNNILPILLDVLSKNKHVDYPQKIFEQGLVTKKKGNNYSDCEVLAITQTHSTANFTEIRQTLESVFRLLGCEFAIRETEHSTYVPGRAVEILVCGEIVGVMGEVHPEVLTNFAIEMPVASAELNVGKLFNILNQNKNNK